VIRLIEARNYKCVKSVRQSLGPFHVLVGPNGSGKSTFFNVPNFLADLIQNKLEQVIYSRCAGFRDLLWQRTGTSFELAVELQIPQDRREMLVDSSYDVVRYEVEIGEYQEVQPVGILRERVLLKDSRVADRKILEDASAESDNRSARINGESPEVPVLLDRNHTGISQFAFHSRSFLQSNPLPFRFSSDRSALGNVPDDEGCFPISIWLKEELAKQIVLVELDVRSIRPPSPPPTGHFRSNGSPLPWLIQYLIDDHPDQHREWILHLSTVLEDLADVYTIKREEDGRRYLVLRYKSGLEVPSWAASDGTLRLLSLTLFAYLPNLSGSFLIEEPENGIHPKGLEAVFQSLSSLYDAQILLATHSPLVVGLAEPSQVLCFSKTEEGATRIVRGDEHAILSHWRGETDLGTLFAGGVLG